MKKITLIISTILSLSALVLLERHNFQDRISSTTEKNIPIQSIRSVQSTASKLPPSPPETPAGTRAQIIAEFQKTVPKIWSENAPGVETRLNTRDKVIALTFDACGGTGSDGYDAKLINFLTVQKIPATLFISGKWLATNLDNFKKLVANPLFEIENHGTAHIPCSADGHAAYGIAGTKNIGEMVDEIELNAEKLQSLTGRKPLFYRSSTAFTDEFCPQVARKLGYTVVSFSVLGDAGATYSAAQIEKTLLAAPPGSIVILHMNHPEKDTAEGVMQAVPKLEKEGFKFVKLEDYK